MMATNPEGRHAKQYTVFGWPKVSTRDPGTYVGKHRKGK